MGANSLFLIDMREENVSTTLCWALRFGNKHRFLPSCHFCCCATGRGYNGLRSWLGRALGFTAYAVTHKTYTEMVELLNFTRDQLVEEVQKKEASRVKLKEKLVWGSYGPLFCCCASL